MKIRVLNGEKLAQPFEGSKISAMAIIRLGKIPRLVGESSSSTGIAITSMPAQK